MTTTQPGWYPSPDDPTHDRWWDGAQWTSSVSPRGVPAAPQRPPLGPRFDQLAGLVQGVLALNILFYVGFLAISLWTARTTSRWLEQPRSIELDEATLVDRLALVTTFLPLGLLLLSAIPFIAWLYRAHRSDRMSPAALRHGSGWAIGGWFVPILSFWRPLQMVNDVRRGAVGHDPIEGTPVVYAWWTLWLTSIVTARVAAGLYPDGDEPRRQLIRGLRDSAYADVVDFTIGIVTLVLAILVVRHVTRLLHASTFGPRSA